MKSKGRFNFINIQKIKIRNFSLYSKNEKTTEVEENINNGVYCLAGANGLGKTTFLNIINYGLTGLVLAPNKDVLLPKEIETENKSYTEDYFKGRINVRDYDKAEIEITFEINKKTYRIVRGFDNRNALRSFEIYNNLDKNKTESILNETNSSSEELNRIYQSSLANDMGIGSFENFVFFQLYVLTFDENRRMLFWNEKASTNTLSMAFNDSLDDTERILELKKEMEVLESHARNARWQATQIKKEMEMLLNTKKEMELLNWDDLKKEYDLLINIVEESEKKFHNIESEYDTLLKRQNIINSEILQYKIQYKRLFSQYSEPRSRLLNNQYVQFSKANHECFLCGAKGHHIIEKIEKNLYQDQCPICDTKIDNDKNKVQNQILHQLEEIDKKIEGKNKDLESLIFESDAKKVELEKAEYNYISSKEKLEKFEKENSSISFKSTGDTITDSLLSEYKDRFEKEDKKADDYYKQRDQLKPEYENLLKNVEENYKRAETYFVPLFKKLSKSFIGLDLNIYFQKKGAKNIKLNFELLGTRRTESYQLSESQRFFLDIALRMTLAIYLSKKGNEATLLIDTPEGSLDIAYENRVGQMFADFVVDYNQNIIMTANINASQLLVALAKRCGEEKMYFRRMLEWTDMTEIQKEGEVLFNEVYENIDRALRGK
ncbi:AAA family ATPase [Hydrogenimonas sp. SS33]|uniref:AAA family ATPase n=1 Tax=Hydrogenimonas leucolamina TaxID=2954236 RepID=UPI00336C3099